MTALSGKFAAIDGVSTARDWTINDQQNLVRAYASNTEQGPARRKGIFEWNGQYNIYGGLPTHLPGQFFTGAFYTAPDDGISGDGVRYDGQAIVSEVVINFNWGDGSIINSQVSFLGHLGLTRAVGAQIIDATTPVLPEIGLSAGVTYGAGDTVWPEIVSATLTLMNDVISRNTSSTVINNVVNTARNAGNIDATLQLQVADNIRTGPPQQGDTEEVKLWVDATDFWHLKWMQVENYSNIVANRETAEIVGHQVNMGFDGWKEGGGGQGTITEPGVTTGPVFWGPDLP